MKRKEKNSAELMAELFDRYPQLLQCKDDFVKSFECIKSSYIAGGKLLTAGNGGSAADSEHIVGELMKGFLKARPLNDNQKAEMKNRCNLIDDELLSKLQGGLPAIAIPSITALNSAFCNGAYFTYLFLNPPFLTLPSFSFPCIAYKAHCLPCLA